VLKMHRLMVWVAQTAAFALAGVAAFLLRFDLSIPEVHLKHLAFGLSVWLVAKSIVFRVAALDRGWWRYVSVVDLVRIGLGNFAGSALAYVVIRTLGPAGFPRSIYLLDLILCFLATSGLRLAARIAAEACERGRTDAAARRTLIYGAGAAGVVLLREIRQNAALPYRVAGFLDDDRAKQGLRVLGERVYAATDLEAVVKRLAIEMVLIAIPSAAGPQMTRILRMCQEAGVAYKTVPGLEEVIEGNGLARQIRDVAVEDLLGRSPVRLEEDKMRATLEGKAVLVTGAAGSIGAELCRQMARYKPAGIVGFEIAESPLFEIDREMRQSFPGVPFFAEIGSIQNRARLDEVMRQYRPSVIYHAAAYKHVPLMEAHVFEAVENNVFGTYNVAMAAAEHGVDDFVMISSDKAVRPTNIMGATKRLAELVVMALQNRRTKYVAVRFGNVLGSNGSVIPILKKQIATGGPVTVTHPEMTRYFMTIPEACQLVLQAAVMAKGGQIYVLEMGEPVKIVDLARNLILLTGMRPDQDIKIAFTGIRPGEKLYEELSTLLEDTVATPHEKVRILMSNGMPEGDMVIWLDQLREICQARDIGRLVVSLKEIVLDYSPSAHLLRRAIEQRDRHVVAAAS